MVFSEIFEYVVHGFAVDLVVAAYLPHQRQLGEAAGFAFVHSMLAAPGSDHGAEPVDRPVSPFRVDQPELVHSLGDFFQPEPESSFHGDRFGSYHLLQQVEPFEVGPCSACFLPAGSRFERGRFG